MNYLFNTTKEMVRRGKQYRVNSDRFFHIMNEGWFVYMRQEQEKVENNNTVAGPFKTKLLASHHLDRIVDLSQLSVEPKAESNTGNSGEDWRY